MLQLERESEYISYIAGWGSFYKLFLNFNAERFWVFLMYFMLVQMSAMCVKQLIFSFLTSAWPVSAVLQQFP